MVRNIYVHLDQHSRTLSILPNSFLLFFQLHCFCQPAWSANNSFSWLAIDLFLLNYPINSGNVKPSCVRQHTNERGFQSTFQVHVMFTCKLSQSHFSAQKRSFLCLSRGRPLKVKLLSRADFYRAQNAFISPWYSLIEQSSPHRSIDNSAVCSPDLSSFASITCGFFFSCFNSKTKIHSPLYLFKTLSHEKINCGPSTAQLFAQQLSKS